MNTSSISDELKKHDDIYPSKWCFGLREKHRLRMFQNKVLRIIFGP